MNDGTIRVTIASDRRTAVAHLEQRNKDDAEGHKAWEEQMEGNRKERQDDPHSGPLADPFSAFAAKLLTTADKSLGGGAGGGSEDVTRHSKQEQQSERYNSDTRNRQEAEEEDKDKFEDEDEEEDECEEEDAAAAGDAMLPTPRQARMVGLPAVLGMPDQQSWTR